MLKDNLDGMLVDALKARDDLEVKCLVHVEVQRDLDGLYESIFQELSEFPEEDSQRREVG